MSFEVLASKLCPSMRSRSSGGAAATSDAARMPRTRTRGGATNLPSFGCGNSSPTKRSCTSTPTGCCSARQTACSACAGLQRSEGSEVRGSTRESCSSGRPSISSLTWWLEEPTGRPRSLATWWTARSKPCSTPTLTAATPADRCSSSMSSTRTTLNGLRPLFTGSRCSAPSLGTMNPAALWPSRSLPNAPTRRVSTTTGGACTIAPAQTSWCKHLTRGGRRSASWATSTMSIPDARTDAPLSGSPTGCATATATTRNVNGMAGTVGDTTKVPDRRPRTQDLRLRVRHLDRHTRRRSRRTLPRLNATARIARLMGAMGPWPSWRGTSDCRWISAGASHTTHISTSATPLDVAHPLVTIPLGFQACTGETATQTDSHRCCGSHRRLHHACPW